MPMKTVGAINTDSLDEFVIKCDSLGGISDPRAREWTSDFSLTFKTEVNTHLDPFSEEYWRSQMQLHAELSGRRVDQHQTELMPINVNLHAQAINPYNKNDPGYLATHKKAVLNAFLIGRPSPGMTVLDMGCGWGLTSEAMAYCGASVTAVDINPQFVELVKCRAHRLALPVKAQQASFDSFESEDSFDLIFFYECLHHSLRPWDTIRHATKFLKSEGKIIWAGEPVNNIWWNTWGMRLDAESVYVMRKFGWWESGWSVPFISECFSRSGLALSVIPGVGLRGGLVGFAVRNECKDDITPDLSDFGCLTEAAPGAVAASAEQNARPVSLGVNISNDSAKLLFRGWYNSEGRHRWSKGSDSCINMLLDPTALAIRKLVLKGNTCGTQRMGILFNGVRLYSGELAGAPEKLIFDLPSDLLKVGENTLQFELPDARVPDNGDPRLLGFALEFLVFE